MLLYLFLYMFMWPTFASNQITIEHCMDAHILPRNNVQKNLNTIFECLTSVSARLPVPLDRIVSELGPSMQHFVDCDHNYTIVESRSEMENLDLVREFKKLQRKFLRTYFEIREVIYSIGLPSNKIHSTLDHSMFKIRRYISSAAATSKEVASINDDLKIDLQRLRKIKTFQYDLNAALEAREAARISYESTLQLFKNVILEEYGDELFA